LGTLYNGYKHFLHDLTQLGKGKKMKKTITVIMLFFGLSGVFAAERLVPSPHLPQGRQRPQKKFGPELLNCVKWQFEADGPVTASVTVTRNSKVYIPCEDGKLYALNAGNGTLRWSYDVNTPLASAAAVGPDGTVYVGDENGKLYAIDKRGELLWTPTTSGPVYSSPVISPESHVYICSLDGRLHALDRDGTELWTFETDGFGAIGGSVFAAPRLASDGTIYIAGLYDPNLYALDPADGGLKWNCNFEFPADPCDPNSDIKTGWPFASPAVAHDGTIYQTLMYDSHLYAIEPLTGTIIWAADLSDPCSGFFEPNYLDLGDLNPPPYWYLKKSAWTSEPALSPDGTIYVSLEDPYLRAVEPNGNLKWATRLGEDGGFTLSVADDGLIYAACDDNLLYLVSPEGQELAQFEGGGWLSFPVLAPGHTLIVSDANNTVWAIRDGECGKPQQILAPAKK
jgi:outer membrane protein assembly factor BamB